MAKKRKSKKYYFTQETEDAIVLYNQTEDPELRKGEKGRAFSYFSIVAKNYLILNNNKNYKNKRLSLNIDESDDVFNMEDEDENIRQKNHINEFIDTMNIFWDEKIPRMFDKERDRNIAYSILELFRYIDIIDSFNKKNIYFLIREMTGYTGQHITPVLKKMKPLQKRIYNDFLSVGTIDFKKYNL